MPIMMPALSPTMTEGTIVEWHVAVGDEVEAGDVLCDIETDKATMAMESSEDGFVSALLVENGTSGIPVGQPVAVMVEEEGEEPDMSTVAAPAAPEAPAPEPVAATPAPAEAPPPAAISAPTTTANTAGSAKPLSPAVLALVNRHGLDASLLSATGPKGHILKGDVLAYLAGEDPVVAAPPAKEASETKPAPASTGPVRLTDGPRYTDVPAGGIRKIIANRLTESKTTIPHSYQTVDVNITGLMALRKQTIEATGVKFSLNDVIIKSAALALRMVPEVNASLDQNNDPVQLPNVDVSIAVASDNGLITPIITGADGRGVTNIAATVREMAGRAREGKLLPEEFQGGSFTISNLGMFGITSFSAVINPPQACILAVGGTRPVVALDHSIQSMCSFTLSSDARVVDDEMAIRYMNAFKKFMENPATML